MVKVLAKNMWGVSSVGRSGAANEMPHGALANCNMLVRIVSNKTSTLHYGALAQLARAPALQAGVRTAGGSSQGDVPMQAMLAIVNSRGRGT